MMIYGSFPAVMRARDGGEKREILKELTDNALYKDILEFQTIRNPHNLRYLLRALAFQVGNECSYSEIGQQIGLNRQTVENYVNLLEQSFVLYRLPPLTRNPRKEISRLKKIYFLDNGVRNSIINQFDETQRPDMGALFESWGLTERMKLHMVSRDPRSHYFWRRKSGAEVDLVEQTGLEFQGFEYKLQDKRSSPPESWDTSFPNARWRLVTPKTFDTEGLTD